MSDWTAGYVADIGYTFGYYPELNPLKVTLAFLNAGLAVPATGTACELGFGQGVSVNVHAAASITQWYGTDFNPSQAAFAQELAGIAGTGAKLYDDAFSEFCQRPDLPDFDFIGLHGIWSWISDANRAVIVDFIRRKLKVGGVVYISYNTLPGWSSFAPMRHLMTQHATSMGASGVGIVQRIEASLQFAQRLLDTNPVYARANPIVTERLKAVMGHNRHYLAHEYFNADWHPMYFADMARWLSPAKMSFACSAAPLEHVWPINFTTEQQALLRDIPDAQLRESVRDYIVNQQFRKDYWVKGPRRLNSLEQIKAVRSLKVVLSSTRDSIDLKVNGALGEATLSEAVYKPLLDLLADHKARSVAQIEQALSSKGVSYPQLLEALMILASGHHLQLVQEELNVSKVKRTADKFNAYIIEKAQGSAEVGYLASPMTGGAVPLDRFSQLLLLARSQGLKQPSDWAQFVWNILAAQGQRIIKEGKQLETSEQNLAELNAQAKTFSERQLPILKALMVA